MRNLVLLVAVTVAAQSCAKNSSADERCVEGLPCTEAGINQPVGPQPATTPVLYGEDPSDPPREELRFPTFDPTWGLKRAIYAKAVAYFETHKAEIANPRWFTIVDFNQNASRKRLYLFDLSTHRLERHNVAHGKNSDPDNDGLASKFSNTPGSLMSSLGFYKTAETYSGGHGYSLRLEGLESTNSNARDRAIVMHPADYVSDDESRAGRSWGCPAVDPDISKALIDRIKNGSILLLDR